MSDDLDLQINVDHRFGTGAEQLRAIAAGVLSPDFIIVGLPAFFLNNQPLIEGYRLLMIPYWEAQCILAPLGGVKDIQSGELIIAEGSAAEMQERACSPLHTLERRYILAPELPSAIRQLQPAQRVIASESVAKPVLDAGLAKRVEESDFRIFVGFYCRTDLLRTNQHAVTSFTRFFLSSWTTLRDRTSMRLHAHNVLKQDHSFLKSYGRAAGINFL
jgi:hypothetical protein